MRGVVVFLALLVTSPALAQAEPPVNQAQLPGHDDPNCFCLANGRMFGPGERVCLKTAEGPRLAQCDMATNVMSWSITQTPCPES
jgi:hypothetical protein